MNGRARLRRPVEVAASAEPSSATAQRAVAPGTASLLHLQGTAGNRAVQRQVREGLIQRGGPEDETPYTAMPAGPASPPPGYGEYRVSPHLPPAPASDANYGPMPSGPGAASATATATPMASTTSTPSATASPAPGPARDAGYGPMPGGPGAASATATATPMPSASASASEPPGHGEYRLSPHLPAGPGGDSSYTAYTPVPGRPASAAPAPEAPLAPGPGPGPAAAHPAPLKLPEKYRDEDKKFGWRAFYGTDPATMSPEERAAREQAAAGTNIVTKYNSAAETAANTLTPSGADGAKALTTATGEKASMRPTVYAMGTGGQIVANLGGRASNMLPTGQKQTIHHSTMLAGADVAHAGHIGMQEGQVNYLDDDSGHYRPTEAHTFDAFNRLAASGVLNPNSATGRVNLVDKKGTKGVDRGESASVHFSGYQQAQGSESGIRNKTAMLKELEQRVPRYEPAEAPAAPAPGPGPAAEDDGGLEFDPSAAGPAPSAPAGPGYNLSPHDPDATPVAPPQPTPAAPAAPAMAAGPMGLEYQVSPHLPPEPAAPAAPPMAAGPMGPEYQVSPHLPPEAVSVPGYDPYRLSPH